MDPDNNKILEKPDLETMYRMIYETETHDPFHIDIFPLDNNNRITKDIFIVSNLIF